LLTVSQCPLTEAPAVRARERSLGHDFDRASPDSHPENVRTELRSHALPNGSIPPLGSRVRLPIVRNDGRRRLANIANVPAVRI